MTSHPFIQPAPQLSNTYLGDRLLQSWLKRHLPEDLVTHLKPQWSALGGLCAQELYELQMSDRLNEPVYTQWDPWGNRADQIVVSPLWQVAEKLSAQYGLVATGYDTSLGTLARTCQFALVYLFTASTDIYSCPLAMTDGAARTLMTAENPALMARALPHLLSRDPEQFWTSGQWMTESIGGSDVGLSTTVARWQEGQWRLYGRKWFTSAATSQIALTLARPEGNPPGGKGLALFYVEPRDIQGQLQGILIHRLKDKLGTRKVPTAELTLDGTPATLVAGTTEGVKQITPMLNITRTWNSVSAISLMRRGLDLAQDYAQKRWAFGAYLADKPLHQHTLQNLAAEWAGAFCLVFMVIELLGKTEHQPEAADQWLLRVLTPLMKLTTAKQAVRVVSEVLEAFGGAGYVEDTGLPMLLRDAQVLPIWEGTTNVLSLDAWKALGPDGVEKLHHIAQGWQSEITAAELQPATQLAMNALSRAMRWYQEQSPTTLEAGARRLALSLGYALEIMLLARHAQWAIDQGETWLVPLLNTLAEQTYAPYL